jgi:alpha-glucosidase (family GH31 glycosyl hydrolase)
MINRLLLLLWLLLCAPAMQAVETVAQVREYKDSWVITTPNGLSNYRLRVFKGVFRYQFERPDGKVIAPAHAVSGLQLGRGEEAWSNAKITTLVPQWGAWPLAEVVTENGITAKVTFKVEQERVCFSVKPEQEGLYRILLRTGGVAPAFGLGDHGGYKRTRSDLTGFAQEHLRGNSAGYGAARLISNFVIFPQQGFAEINIEPWIKIVRLTKEENVQGSKGVRELPAMYYFFGAPQTIYRNFLAVRNAHGYRVYQPKYEWFGVGWEAWGALAWETRQQTVIENVSKYLELGYPLRWMVVGSGFWPRHDENLHATTSFGMWDKNLYPDPKSLIEHFHQRGLKFIIGLRISFITEGPFAAEGVKNGYFLQENGRPQVFKIGFPRKPCYLLDAHNTAAVNWYIELCKKWLAYGIDGFKEDIYGYGQYDLRDDKLDPVNEELMKLGVYVMGRNGYLGSPADLHRYDDFNYDQNQDRGPLNGFSLAYSGFPYVYPDIVGGTFAESDMRKMPPLSEPKLRRYYVRNAQYASVNPSMSMGFGPWNFNDEEVSRVTLEAARLHDRLHPYIYSAALDAYRTGFPYTLTPLSLAYPEDKNVYELENTARRGYEWLIGESLLAVPLYGDDYATAETRDVYLPRGSWVAYDTGKLYAGPTTLKAFPLPVGKTPLFIGGKGIVVEQRDGKLLAFVYPIANKAALTFNHRNGQQTQITVNVGAWQRGQAKVTDGAGKAITTSQERGALVFPLEPAQSYVIR